MENKKELTEEQKQKHVELFNDRLRKLGFQTETFESLFGDKLKDATYTFSNKDNTACGSGEFLQTILRVLTPTALKINALLPEDKRCEEQNVVIACLLSQISKIVMVSPNDNKWEIENRGMIYKFNNFPFAMKMGMRSIAMCIQSGFKLSDNVIEAISNLDREDDKQVKFFSSTLATVLRQAIELTDIMIRKRE